MLGSVPGVEDTSLNKTQSCSCGVNIMSDKASPPASVIKEDNKLFDVRTDRDFCDSLLQAQ